MVGVPMLKAERVSRSDPKLSDAQTRNFEAIKYTTAAQLVAAVPVGAFAGNDKLASYCGLTPRDTRSGATISSTSPSPEGNRCLKNLLIFTCLSLVRSDNEFGRYYRACRSRGMRHTAALKATARRRLKVIYAVMRDVRPYEPR